MKQLMIESAPEKAESRRVVEKDLIKELRSVLDRLLELQADSAPNDIIERSVRGAGRGSFPAKGRQYDGYIVCASVFCG
jgi:hypothetical protein